MEVFEWARDKCQSHLGYALVLRVVGVDQRCDICLLINQESSYDN